MASINAFLMGVHTFRDVEYVDIHEDGDVKYNLCGTGWMTKAFRGSHFHGRRHRKRYNALIQIQALEIQKRELVERKDNFYEKYNDRFTALSKFDSRVSLLGLEKWQWKMNDLRYKHIFTDKPLSFDNNEEQLVKYENMERTSLLELAIWKKKLLGDTFFTIDVIHEYRNVDDSSNFKHYAYQVCIRCGMEVIIPCVISFL